MRFSTVFLFQAQTPSAVINVEIVSDIFTSQMKKSFSIFLIISLSTIQDG